MIVAITGANGFIGRHLCRRFAAAGWDVRPIVRADYVAERVSALVKGADVLIHAAGATRARSATVMHRSNVTLTKRTLDAALRAGVQRFVFISSQAAAGPAPSRESIVDENTPPVPVEEYGRSKLAAESEVKAVRLPWTIVRPAAVYGPGDRDFLQMFRLARHGLAIYPGTRDHWLSIAHVRDIVDGIFSAATNPRAERRTYFLGGPEPQQWRWLFHAAARAAGQLVRAEANVPGWLVRIAARAGDIKATFSGRVGLLTTEKARLGKPAFWICSSERARRELDFAPRVALQDGLRETYLWYRKAGWL